MIKSRSFYKTACCKIFISREKISALYATGYSFFLIHVYVAQEAWLGILSTLRLTYEETCLKSM